MSERTSDKDAATEPSPEEAKDEPTRNRAMGDDRPLASVPPTIITDGAKQREPTDEG